MNKKKTHKHKKLEKKRQCLLNISLIALGVIADVFSIIGISIFNGIGVSSIIDTKDLLQIVNEPNKILQCIKYIVSNMSLIFTILFTIGIVIQSYIRPNYKKNVLKIHRDIVKKNIPIIIFYTIGLLLCHANIANNNFLTEAGSEIVENTNPLLTDEQKIVEHYIAVGDKYVIPYSELETLTDEELSHLHDGIFARAGLEFRDDERRNYYNKFTWYNDGYISYEEFTWDNLSEISKENINNITNIIGKRKNNYVTIWFLQSQKHL